MRDAKFRIPMVFSACVAVVFAITTSSPVMRVVLIVVALVFAAAAVVGQRIRR